MTCRHNWTAEMYEGALSRYCHVCREWEVELELHVALLALRSVLMLSRRIRQADPESAEHLVRFCRDGGVEASILRDDGGDQQ
jgi:hypothetical protein